MVAPNQCLVMIGRLSIQLVAPPSSASPKVLILAGGIINYVFYDCYFDRGHQELKIIAMVAEIFREGETDLGLLCEEVIDMCLHRGSKDNMTALVIQMPAQAAGEEVGGVMERRRLREAAVVAEDEFKKGGGRK